jgi:flagellar basal body P-ring formation protein FlgA
VKKSPASPRRHLCALAAATCLLAAHTAPIWAAEAQDAGVLDAALAQQVRKLAAEGTRASAQASRVEVSVGQLDPRLRLAPCEKVEPYLPPNTRLWGRSRIGLRCVRGPSAWNVYLPITVKVYAPALVAATALPAGAVLAATDLREAEIDWAEEPGGAFTQPESLLGRTLARPLSAGQGPRPSHLKPRLWFAAGDTVRVITAGSGFSAVSTGEALTPGVEGQTARVRTDGGRVVTGSPVATRQLELAL